jgi:hypothetical protein
MRARILAFLASLAVLTPGVSVAQEEADELRVLELGEMAPDFELLGATRFGVLRDPVRLSDFRGKTVVLAFFFRARTPG